MPKASKRLPASASVSPSALSNATSALEGLQEKPRASWSLREAVLVLQESISAALSKGYSYDEVAKLLSDKGINISASSLKSYLSAAKRQQGTKAIRAKKSGRRSQTTKSDVSLNGSAPVTPIVAAKKSVNSEVPKSAKPATQRKTKAAATPTKTAAKAKPVAKTTRKTVTSSAKTAPKTTPKTTGRGRKKSS